MTARTVRKLLEEHDLNLGDISLLVDKARVAHADSVIYIASYLAIERDAARQLILAAREERRR